MGDFLTSWRHLFTAVLVLGADEGTIDERLREAYHGGLNRISRNPGLPEYLRADFDNLMTELDELLSAPRPLDTKQASRLAKQVVGIYDRLTKELQ
jgi:hypothetical protein